MGRRWQQLLCNGKQFHRDLPAAVFSKKRGGGFGLLVPLGQKKALALRSYSFSSDGKKMLVYTNTKRVWREDTRGDYWVLELSGKTLRQLGKGRPASSLMFAKISPDGKKAAYVSGHNLYSEDLATGKITQLTMDGTDRVINGTFDWAYEEEFDCRDGFRWSPDSKSIAYWQIDARKIRNFLLINNTDSLYSFTIPVEYPKAGEDPSSCRIGIVDLATRNTKWMKVPGDPVQHYIPRMEWAAGSTEVILEQLNRKQNEAAIFLCSASTGAARQIYTEKDKAWIDVKARWSDVFSGGNGLSGKRIFMGIGKRRVAPHLPHRPGNGKEVLLTKGDYDMIRMQAIDEKGGYVYFMASPDNATGNNIHTGPHSMAALCWRKFHRLHKKARTVIPWLSMPAMPCIIFPT